MKQPTPFGKSVRKLRIDKGETQMEVAQSLGVSVAFWSALETGKKNVPTEVLESLIQHYDLDQENTDSLRHDAWVSRKEVKINMRNLDDRSREIVAGFARKFEKTELSEEQLEKLRELFGMGKK